MLRIYQPLLSKGTRWWYPCVAGCSWLAPRELVVERSFDYRASPGSCATVHNSHWVLCITRNDAIPLWFRHISSDIDGLKWGRLGLIMAVECLLFWRHSIAVEDNVVWRFPMLQAPLTSSKLVSSSQGTHIISYHSQSDSGPPGEQSWLNIEKTHPKSHGFSSLSPHVTISIVTSWGSNPPFSGTKAMWWLVHSSLLLHVYCLRQPVLITEKPADFPILWFDISARLTWWKLGVR